ncbi:uncharacterized protein LOC100883204 isoform X2 [Megachile rotundata]|uniref:uncharacterized protein LOC100883204 isoform X2 n=1 Tax=Megachile rotundata TaxID=143995 RepID=UPI00061510E7|nr:PREDICTED: uncharacterized protein LOC100883204 isoform X2 [Megachile rotundata]
MTSAIMLRLRTIGLRIDAKMRLEEDLVIRRSRPTMISAKYRAREERRRLLKISAGKLRRIEDPEASLCRSVLINNAVRRLQRENRDEKTRNYGLPVVTYLNDSTKENNVSSNLIVGVTDDETSSRKRLNEDARNEGLGGAKRQRHDDLDLQDDVFSDFYILPPTPRLLSHIDEVQQPESPHHHHHLVYPEDRLGSVEARSGSSIVSTSSANTTNTSTSSANSCCNSVIFPGSGGAGETNSQLNSVSRSNDVGMMEASDVVDPDRICDFARFADSAKSLEERLVELQSLDEHFDLAKFERNNNQSCGRAFHDIQTFHSLVPGLET